MTIQPKFHWQFDEREGTTTVDAVSGVQAQLSKAELDGHGRIGHAIRIRGKEGRVNLGNMVGQFGTSDFTVAFGMKNISTHGDNELDIIGDQAVQGHGNFFSVRLFKARIFFHVDENSKAKNYVRIMTDPLPMIKNRTWFHVAVVREGPTLKIYIDGILAAEGASETGVADLNNDVDVKLGHSRRGTPTAHYEDLRIYHTALDATQIQNLIPPLNRLLRPGEIELVATDDAAVILAQDVADLSPYSPQFRKLRLGPDTGATLYKGTNFGDVAQKLYADIPDTRLSKLGDFPQSVHIWSSVGEPFTGKWIIKAPNGQYLSRRGATLTTAPQRLLDELFVFHYNLPHAQPQLIPSTQQEGLLLQVADVPAVLLVDDSESHQDAFSIVNTSPGQWLHLKQDNTFTWTERKADRAVFFRTAKMADHEGQVGELTPGEVALYEHRAYHGRTWILSDSEQDVLGNYPNLESFHGLDDQTSSIRLGPDTGVTLFKNRDHQADDGKREEEIEAIVDNVPDLKESQVGNDTISSLQIFKTIAPEDVFTSYTTKLSQDYRMVGNNLEEFSAYRTTLRFEPGADEIEVSATDLTTIEVEGTLYEIDEVRSAMLSPNQLNFIMITSEADGLNTPGLKIRTSAMARNEQVVIFPNEEVHQQIAELEDDALWNATDTQGNLIVDRNAHSKEEVASVQNTIKRVTATVTATNETPVVNTSGGSRVQAPNRVVSGAAIDQPWELKFTPPPDNNDSQRIVARTASLQAGGSAAALVAANSPLNGGIQEAAVSQDDFTRLLSQATSSEGAESPGAVDIGGVQRVGAIRRLRIGRRIRDAIKKATSVVIGAVKGVVHFIVRTAEGIIDFVIDTVEKIGEFVEAVVEKVVKTIKQFIEFLQFLFNWDDILKTQRYLVGAINAGFDYVKEQAEAAKAPVSAFVNDLQDTVEDGMNTLVETLGGKPSEVKDSGFELPEAAEWFLSKLTGGSKKSDANTTANVGADPSEDSPLESFLRHFLEAFENAVSAAIRLPEGLIESIASLITNPRQPERALIALIEAFRDAIIQSLEAVENVALGLLDVIRLAADLFQKLLNAEIKIPFISDLFELLGAGKLTMLNLTTILVAIPVTVVSKLLFNERPFRGAAPLAFSTQPEARLLLAASQTASDEGEEQDPGNPSNTGLSAREKSIRDWGLVSMLALFLKGLVNVRLDVVSENLDEVDEATGGTGFEFISLLLDFVIWLGSFPSSPGFPGGRPYNLLAHPVSKSNNETEYWERVMWGWRTAMFWLDVVVVAVSGMVAIKTKDPNLQRMKRRDLIVIPIYFVLSLVDLGLTSKYLSTLPEEGGKSNEIAYHLLSQLPNSFGLLRLPSEPLGTIGSVILVNIDLGMASFGSMAGLALINDKLDAFSQAG